MDLLDCPNCYSRYIVTRGGETPGWICRVCAAELRLVAKELPGSLRQAREALRADLLRPVIAKEAEDLTGEGA